jgi:hypothetical protein
MSKVYIITGYDSECEWIIGVYSSLAKASKDYYEISRGSHPIISEFEVDSAKDSVEVQPLPKDSIIEL